MRRHPILVAVLGLALAAALVLPAAAQNALSRDAGFALPAGKLASNHSRAPEAEVPVTDGSFENGPPPASAWSEWTNTECEWIGDWAAIWGVGAQNGTNDVWLGGYCGGVPATTGVEQSIGIPAGATNLRFWTLFYRTDADDGGDTFNVGINGTVVYTLPLAQASNTFPDWVERVVDISAYSGQMVTLLFEGLSSGESTGNVRVDNIRIELATVAGAGATLVDESCTPVNGVLDPSELVTVSFCVENTTAAATTNLIGTLLAGGGVVDPSGPAAFGVVPAGGTVCQEISFTVDPALACGDTVTATMTLADGATTYEDAVYTFVLGVPALALSEGFDGVTPPALPAGWVATNAVAGDGILWVTSAASADSPPNAAFVNNPGAVSDKLLDSPPLPVTTATAQLGFRHSFNLESGFDGGVLEISIAGGAFADIEAAGGSFAQGGYTDTISTCCSNPIGGRDAWSGNSGGFITTLVNLPAAAAGQNVVLRWRMASDSSVSAPGWYVDSIELLDGYACATECETVPSVSVLEIPTLSQSGLLLLAGLLAAAAAGLLFSRRG